jgi:hypothetical protein
MKSLKIILIGIIFFMFPMISIAQLNLDIDKDSISDNVEQALALRYAPEWRFSKKTMYPNDEIKINNSNQNEQDEENYPNSAEYLVDETLRRTGKYPTIRLISRKINPQNNVPTVSWHYFPFSSMNELPNTVILPSTRQTASDVSLFGDGCVGVYSNDMSLIYPENLYGQPLSFPTYYHCNKTSDGNAIEITYFLFSAFDNKHEFGSDLFDANHRGDWEWYTIVITGVDGTLNNIGNTVVKYLKFNQHGGPKQYLLGNSGKLRWVNGTHPKIYIALTSHATYPQPGVLFNYDTPLSSDKYDDIFLGNGLIVQSWNTKRLLENLGEKNRPFPERKWTEFKGAWGADDSPYGPLCKVDPSLNDEILAWDEWITEHPDGYSKYWRGHDYNNRGIYLDCNPKFSNNYVPSSGYTCSEVIDFRKTCNIGGTTGSDARVWSSLKQASEGLPNTQIWQICIIPGNYPGAVTVNKKMVLKAIEGTVIIGR